MNLSRLCHSSVSPALLVAWAYAALAFPAAASVDVADSVASVGARANERLTSIVSSMQAEQKRALASLTLDQRLPPYYIGYTHVGVSMYSLEASLGALRSEVPYKTRFVRVDLRVGSPQLDNSNFVSQTRQFSWGEAVEVVTVPLRSNKPAALRRALWLATDRAYRAASDDLEEKRAIRQSAVATEEPAFDFSSESVESLMARAAPVSLDTSSLKGAVVDASSVFLSFPGVHEGTVSLAALREQRVFVSTEGVVSVASTHRLEVRITASTQAADGSPITHVESLFVSHLLPNLKELLSARAQQVAESLLQTRDAPLVDDYSGPVLFEGVAAPQILLELTSNALNGTPAPDGQGGAWSRKYGKRVLPTTLSMSDDPRPRGDASSEAVGRYAFDDQGIWPHRVELVVDGRLRSLLMSRTPSREQPHSNGHGRSGLSGWARGQGGNLILHSKRGKSPRQLRRALLSAVRAEGGEYGLVVQSLQPRGFASGGASPPALQKVLKLYPGGREVLVRGASLAGLSVRDLRDILAAGKKATLHNYQIETGVLPIFASVAAPALLFEQVEIRRPSGEHELPPVIPRPALVPYSY